MWFLGKESPYASCLFSYYDSCLFSYLSPEAVIRRFEQRDHAVDSRGVAEYIRALVATNAIADYLPDEQSGKPSSLPSLVLDYGINSFVLSVSQSFPFELNKKSKNGKKLLPLVPICPFK